MTRFEALNIASAIVERSKHPDKVQIVQKLEQCMKKLSNRKWNEENIFAYCDKVIEEKGRLLMSDLSISGAPGRGDIACAFRMTAREFRDQYYPLKSPLAPMSRYFYKSAEEWTDLFIEDYRRIMPKTQSEYNQKRGAGLPRWNAIAKMNGLSSWRELLIKLGLKQPKPERIWKVLHKSPAMELLEEFLTQRETYIKELELDCFNSKKETRRKRGG